MNLKYAPYSFSKINTQTHCPQRFKLQYIDKIKTPWNTSPSLEKGSFLHKVLETKLENGDVKSVIKSFKFTEFKSYKDLLPEIKKVLSNDSFIGYMTEPKRYVEKSFGLYFKDNDLLLSTYKKDPVLGNPTIRGYIDLIIEKDDEILIVDHKSGSLKKDMDKMQLNIYFLVAALMFPKINKFTIQYDFIEHNKIVDTILFRDDFDNIKYTIINTLNKIETDKKYEKITKFCNWCPYFGEHCDGVSEEEITFL
jgi:ATP-dependent exoDNAse (exonuclease V) beta subunit